MTSAVVVDGKTWEQPTLVFEEPNAPEQESLHVQLGSVSVAGWLADYRIFRLAARRSAPVGCKSILAY